MRRSRFGDEEIHINLTPLIDVVFVILIMFIVVAPLLDLDTVELAPHSKMPLGQSLSPSNNHPLRITVFADESISINATKVSAQNLARYFAFAKKKFPDVRPQLYQDQKASFGVYQKVKNALEEVGFTELDVILKPN